MTHPENRPMTPEEASPLIGLAAQTLKNLAKKKQIRHTRPAGTNVIRFTQEDVDAILAASVVMPERPQLVVVSRRRRAA